MLHDRNGNSKTEKQNRTGNILYATAVGVGGDGQNYQDDEDMSDNDNNDDDDDDDIMTDGNSDDSVDSTIHCGVDQHF